MGLTGVIANHVHGVSATDPLSYAVGALLMALFAVLACYLPARRAARTDAMLVLR